MIERAIGRWTGSKIHGASLLSYLVDSYDPLLLDDEERSTEIEFVTTSKQGQFSENSLAVFDENRTLVAQAET